MKRKWIKNSIICGLLLVGLGSSISIKKLDEVRANAAEVTFDATAYAKDFWEEELIPDLEEAVEVGRLAHLLKNRPQEAFDQHSEALGIGNIRFFMIKGKGEIRQVGEDDLTVLVTTDTSSQVVKIETEYIFGNAVRDASGKVDLTKFEQTMDFNNVSAAINQLVREKVLPPLKANAKEGNMITFVGAVEMNREQVNLNEISVIPVNVTFLKQSDQTAHVDR
ncbi:DUF2291 domain-containing protein [Echinicola vietnamensis]|uniref:Putative periplasmic lipoprotein (DUF2291) n=1 Tax=Echinicola vietnamensis (strain DSM 17526 / LMG 23754 / KMM 6221) TaxID=926556 RepID=L0FUK2_ECHVK|nr:DUF2291 domain-containing protein [Echinicola vietnamensis]AGA77554.1 putative periplasmic lipoprotein (DUF2291) [Echinicola vietnamensis DSM 17526]